MLTDFMVRATIAGIAVAIVAAPLGCFVVWRRLAYFGDATAHAAMLGIAMALALDIPIFGGTLIAALIMAWAVTQLSGSSLASDTLLGVFAHAGLAMGLVIASLLSGVRIDLMAYLFGDILAVTQMDLFVIIVGMLAVSIKVVGILLISALLVIPAAAARNISQTPEYMVICTAILGIISAIVGLQFSYLFNSPPGPSIVCVCLTFFIFFSSIKLLKIS